MRLAARARKAVLLTPLALLAVGGPAVSYPDVPDDTDRALAIIDTLQLTAGLDSTLVVLDAWIPLARSAQDARRLAGLLNREGAILTVWGRVRDAEPILREAVDLARTVSDTLILCGSIRWLGVAVSAQGRRTEAHVLYEELVELGRTSGDRRHEGWGFVGLGWEAHEEGRAADSARYYREAVAAFEEEDDLTARAWSLNGLGTALSGLGDYRSAIDCYGRAAELARQVPHPPVESYAVNNLGALEFSLGDPSLAQASFERAVELQLAIGAQRESIIPSLNVAICQTYLGRHADAVARLEETLAICRREHYLDIEGSILNQLARVRAAQLRHHAAAGLFRESLALDDALTFKSRVEAVIGLSSALAALDSSEAAITLLEASTAAFRDGDEPELWLQLAGETGTQLEIVGRPEEALSYVLPAQRQAQRLGLREHRVGALITAARCYRALDRPDSALAHLEAAVDEWESYRSSPLDPEWRELRSAESRALYTDLADLMLGPGSPARDTIEPAFDRLQRFKARTLLERMLGPGKVLDDALRSEAMTPITLTALQERVLERGEVLLDFFVGSRTSLLFLVSDETCHVVRLPPALDLEPQVRLYHELVSAPAPVDPVAEAEMIERVGQAMSELLLGEVRPLLPEAGRLVIAPDGVLNLVPFASLPLADGNGGSVTLLERWECVRVPSATILAHQHHRQANGQLPADLRALAVAATETARGESLPGAVREVEHLARRYAGFESRIGPNPRSASPSAGNPTCGRKRSRPCTSPPTWPCSRAASRPGAASCPGRGCWGCRAPS
jgi:tetratricopeptide (TPR) repeat protein